MKNIENVSRRDFLKLSGISATAFMLGVNLPLSKVQAEEAGNHELNFFVSLDGNGDVTLVCHRSEMGQGIRTSVPQIIADELEADWSKISVVQAKADRKYGSQGTAGSASIRNYFTTIRQTGAVARDMLEQAAANIWQVDKSSVQAKQHYIHHKKTGQKIGFGELAKHAAKLTPPDPKTIKLKANADFSLIGKDVKQVDLDNIVEGKAQYAQDIQLDNMLIASIQRPPVVGGKVKSFDATEAKKVKGVVDVIQLKDRPFPVNVMPLSGIAVVATNTWAAIEGRKKLLIQWDHGNKQVHNSESFKKELITKVNQPGNAVNSKGDVYAHKYNAQNTLEATYTVPYINHAPMETPAATAMIQGDKCTVWAGTQNPQWAQGMVAQELGLKREDAHKVELNVTLMGGAFGRKSKGDFIIELSLIHI